MSLISAMNPTAPITTEAEAQAAARSSAIAIIIGVIYGVIGIIITFATMESIKTAAAAQAAASGGPDAGAIAGAAVSAGIWMAVGFTVIQAILAVVQWRKPNKIIAFIFLALIALGLAGTLASVAMMGSGAMPSTAPATPIWQVGLAVVVYAIEAILHVAGIRGIGKLDKMQLDAANSAY